LRGIAPKRHDRVTSDRLFDVRSRSPTPLPPLLVQVFCDSPVARAVARVGAALELDVRACTDPTLSIAPDTAAVIVAAHGRDEEPVLRAALAAKVPYIALVADPSRYSRFTMS
jgi:xanthine/CO dehydrogenase XdhC/CoxF family maturation factor